MNGKQETIVWVVGLVSIVLVTACIAAACAITSVNRNHDKADIVIACIESGQTNCDD